MGMFIIALFGPADDENQRSVAVEELSKLGKLPREMFRRCF